MALYELRSPPPAPGGFAAASALQPLYDPEALGRFLISLDSK